ncbi:MAG: DUF4231 domain-containing protein [Lentimicrobium sp.]
MDREAFSHYLENRYEGQMNYYKSANRKNQTRYRQFQWTLIVLSAIAPVITALITRWPHLQIAAVVVTALVAILTTGLKTFQYQELWANYRAIFEQLKPEIHYYNFSVGPYGAAGVDKESLFVARVETILDKEHQGWPPAKKIREDQNPAENANPGTIPADTPGEIAETAG